MKNQSQGEEVPLDAKEVGHNENEEFESISGKSSNIQEELKQLQATHPKNYSTKKIPFPELDPKTLRLYSMYQQNNTLITNLKQQIARLQRIKQQSVYLEQQPPKASIDTSVSQFFLSCQETYEKRQLQLLALKKDIKTIDTEQVRILMAKNENIRNLSEMYFGEFKTIVDVKTYEQGLVLLTEQKKRGKKKREHTIEEQMSKLGLDSEDGSSVNKSGIKSRKQQKLKHKYLIRFVNFSQLFAQLDSDKGPFIDKMHYMVPLCSDNVPISLAYSQKLKLTFILFKNNTIIPLSFSDHDREQSVHQNQSSHKTEQTYPKLTQIPGIKIEFDMRVKVIWWEVKEDKLYVLTSDSLLRIYELVVKQAKLQQVKISTIVYCQCPQKQLGKIVDMCFSGLNPQDLLFITTQHHLFQLNLKKLKPQILYTYNEQLNKIKPFYLEAQDKIFFSTQNFDPIETRILDRAKLITNEEKTKVEKKELKILCFERGERVFVMRVEKNGLVTGMDMHVEDMSPQVEIIQTAIEE